MNLEDNKANDLLYVSFNQDYGCFACGTSTGFFICDSNPLRERFRRDFDDGGIGIVEMLFRCNILALVGGGKQPKFPKNKVMIWDDHQEKCIAELEFRSEVKAVKLRRDRIVVVLQNKVYVYNFADLKLLMDIETSPNPTGLSALSPASDKIVLAVPGATRGEIRVERQATSNDANAAAPAPNNPNFIVACQSQLSHIAIDVRGSRIASASEKGTIIRVFDGVSGTALDQFRRGSSQANVQCIAFNFDSTIIAVTSDKGTLHFFSVGGENKGSRFKSLLPSALAGDYFESKWSFTSITVPEQHSICGFIQDPSNTLIVLGASGTYYRISLTADPSTKQLVAKEEARASFLKADQAL